MLNGNDSKSTLRGIVRQNCSTWLSLGSNGRTEHLSRKKSRLEIEETEAETVRFIYKLYASGMGYKAIVNRLNKGGQARYF